MNSNPHPAPSFPPLPSGRTDLPPGPPTATAQHAPSQPQSAPFQRPTSFLSPTAEGLGYAGGLLTLLSVLYLLSGVWHSFGSGLQAALTAAAALALGTAATVVGDDDDLTRRLSSMLWVLTGISGTFTSYLIISEVADLGVDAGLLAAGVTVGSASAALWSRTRQITFAILAQLSTIMIAFSASGLVFDTTDAHAVAMWLIGMGWLIAGLADQRFRHRVLVAIGAVTALGSAQAVNVADADSGTLLGLVVVAVMAVGAFRRTRRDYTVWTILGGLVFVPQAIAWIPEDLSWPLVMLTVGIGMVVSCAILVSRSRRAAASADE